MNQQATQIKARSAVQPFKTNGLWLQRKCACGSYGSGTCDKCRNEESTLQRSAISATEPSSIPSIVNDVLSSSGQPLDHPTRNWMEPRFGHDFSNVRVHTDNRAAESARSVNADAYTVGNNVVFGDGQYAPGEFRGQRLIAHELTHVLQQSNSSPGLIRFGEPDSAAELEADQISGDVMRGGDVHDGPSRQAVSLQRQATGTAPPTASPAGASPPASQPGTAPTSQPAAPTVPAVSPPVTIRTGRHGNFDAQLERGAAVNPQRRATNEPCRLILTVRVRLNFQDTQTPSRWTPTEQTRWQNEFISAVTNRWSFRFLLEPGGACAAEPCQLATAIFRVEPVTSGQHHTVNVFYSTPSGARSGVSLAGSTFYREDIDRSGSDLRTEQRTVSHEAGHMLGLGHVHCNTNNDECYGTNREESADIMGRGEIVTERDYLPFVTAMQQITSCSTWRVRGGARGPLFGNNALALSLTLGAMGAVAGAFAGLAIGGGGAAAALGILGGLAAGAIGYGIGRAID